MRSLVSALLLLLAGVASTGNALAGEYNLTLDEIEANVTGRPVRSMAINDQIPGPTLRFKEGEDVTIHVTNNLREEASIHWHGIILPSMMDGVPGLNGYPSPGIKPGETFTYRFPVRQSGTYWYHSHSGTQEQAGIYAPIIIAPREPDPVTAARDYVVMFSDFTEENANEILRNLKNDHAYYNRGRRTIGDFFRDARKDGVGSTVSDRLAWGEMRMDPTDMADVSGYTFLVNGKSPAQNWTGLFQPGERVRLRFINGSSMSYFDVRIPGLKMIVVQADGQNVEPVPVDEFRMAVAETYDVIVIPKEHKAYTILAEPIDRSGYARATLAPRDGMQGEIPPLRPRALLTMADMGAMHGGMSHDMPSSDSGMAGSMDHSSMSSMQHGDMSAMDHSKMAMPQPTAAGGAPRGWADASSPPGTHALSYSELRSLEPQKDVRPPDREIIVRLGGTMERYIWTINGAKAENAQPIEVRQGERVKVTFVNETMMAHPMHLHGMYFQLLNGQSSDHLPSKHVVNVPPGGTTSVMLTADQPGDWAFHCHLLYHMTSGMMTKLVVARVSAEAAR